MRKSRMRVVALGLATILSLPVLGMALAAPRESMTARILKGEAIDITVLPPLAKRTTWYGGAVIPVKVLVVDPDEGIVENGNVTLWVNEMPATSPGNANVDNNFTYIGEGMYQFNLNTKPYPAGPGSEPIKIDILVVMSDDHETMEELFIALR